MFVRTKKKDEKRWQVQIVESIRQGDTVKQKIVRSIGVAHSAREVEQFKKIGEKAIVEIKNARQPVLAFEDPDVVYAPKARRKPVDDTVKLKSLKEESRLIEGIQEVFGAVYRKMGAHELIQGTEKDKQWNEVLQACVLSRITEPTSKLATSEFLRREFDLDVPVQKIYRMLDHLASHEEQAKKLVAAHTIETIGGKVSVAFFDVTTLYFESIVQDDLRSFGFSKDCKFKESQVMLALLATDDGLPITYELFAGKTFEGHTLIEVAKSLKAKYDIKDVTLVADRAMFNEDNLSLMEKEGISYIVAAKLRSVSKPIKDAILTNEFRPLVANNEFSWVFEIEHKSRRVVVNYSAERARKDRADRQRLVDRLLKKVRDKTVSLKEIIGNNGTKKYLKLSGKTAAIDQDKIDQDAEWDGLHGIVTDMKDAPAAALLERYRGLWQIEESFRINKHTLKMRPIYHWSVRRIKAHISLCFLAYATCRYTQLALKKAGLKESIESIRNELRHVQASVLVDETTGKRYGLPSAMSQKAASIYRALKLKRDNRPYELCLEYKQM